MMRKFIRGFSVRRGNECPVQGRWSLIKALSANWVLFKIHHNSALSAAVYVSIKSLWNMYDLCLNYIKKDITLIAR